MGKPITNGNLIFIVNILVTDDGHYMEEYQQAVASAIKKDLGRILGSLHIGADQPMI